ncbi:MAG: hypothetical protein Q8R16_02120 [bacterium]|nr:hypothetical protein [bacterium]
MPTTKRPHRHSWRHAGTTGGSKRPIILKRCRCGERRERNANAAEAAVLRQQQQRDEQRMREMFRPSREFDRRFRTKDGSKWRYTGYDLMVRVERWAKRHPDRVKIVGCDDNHHASSILCVIERSTAAYWMGLDVVVIPQHGGTPQEFFLYPNAADALETMLRASRRKRLPIERLQRARTRNDARDLRSARSAARRA